MAETTPRLIDEALADQIFETSSADDARMIRDIFEEFCADLPQRLSRLRAEADGGDPAEACRELHQLRGVIANFAMTTAAARLQALEMAWPRLAKEARQAEVDLATEEIEGASRLLRARFACLR